MNVLIFVMTLLMLLSMMTYARLETYRSSQIYQLFFNKYMEEGERGYINKEMEQKYIDTVVSTGSGGGGGAAADATPRISLVLLRDKGKREKQEKEWKGTKYLLKRLIDVLYSDQPFYREAVDKNPQIVDGLINALVEAVDALPEDKKLKRASEIANLSISDPDMKEFLYKILLGAEYKAIVEEDQPTIGKSRRQEYKGDSEANGEGDVEDQDDESLKDEGKEFKSPQGYFSLLDFINLSTKTKVRVYLAPREVLMSVFKDNSDVVDEIMSQRMKLYREAIKDGDVGALKTQFSDLYKRYIDPEIDEKMIDFSISKTNPKVYDQCK